MAHVDRRALGACAGPGTRPEPLREQSNIRARIDYLLVPERSAAVSPDTISPAQSSSRSQAVTNPRQGPGAQERADFAVSFMLWS